MALLHYLCSKISTKFYDCFRLGEPCPLTLWHSSVLSFQLSTKLSCSVTRLLVIRALIPIPNQAILLQAMFYRDDSRQEHIADMYE